MSLILSIYYYINVAFGLINIHYKASTISYNLYHWPIIIYGAVFNIISMILQQFVTYIFWQESLYCRSLTPMMFIDILFLILNYILYLVIVFEGWLKRKRLWKILYKFKNLLKYYLTPIRIHENHELVMHTRNLLLLKSFSSFCEIVIIYLDVFKTLKSDKCEFIKQNIYIGSILYFVIIDMNCILVDINIYIGLTLINMCVQMLIKRLKNIEHDIKLMHFLQRSQQTFDSNLKSIHSLWRQKLHKEILLITRDECKLKYLAEEIFSIFQLQLLFILLSDFVALIALLRIFLSYLINFQDIETISIIFNSFILLSNTLNVILFFNSCQSLLNSFEEMSRLVYNISIYASVGIRKLFRQDELVFSVSINIV